MPRILSNLAQKVKYVISGSEEKASKYKCEIHLGPGNLEKVII